MHLARRLHFTTTHDPVDFVRRVVAASPRSTKANLVLAPISETSDFAVCARIAASVLGTYFADPKDFVNERRDCGCQYRPQWRDNLRTFRWVVAARLGQECPTLPALLRALSSALGSCFEFYEEESLVKTYKKDV